MSKDKNVYFSPAGKDRWSVFLVSIVSHNIYDGSKCPRSSWVSIVQLLFL